MAPSLTDRQRALLDLLRLLDARGYGRRDGRLVVAAADEAGMAMVFTGMRHFRH